MSTQALKQTISRHFNRAALTYDKHCMVQQRICQCAIQLLLNYRSGFDVIADFACGTGESTRALLENLQFKACYALDFSEQSLNVCKNKLSHTDKINYIHDDFEHFIKLPTTLDLIVCNMGLQWSSDIVQVIALWRDYLNLYGMLLFTIPLAENFPELKAKYKPNFLTHNQVLCSVANADWQLLNCERQTMTLQFASQREAIASLKFTGANFNKSIRGRDQGLLPIKTDQFFTHANVNCLTYQTGIYLMRRTR